MANALMLSLMPFTAEWSLGTFLQNAKGLLDNWGTTFILIVGLALIIYGGIKLFKAVTGRTGSTGPEWLKVILSLGIGGLLFFGGLGTLKNVGGMGDDMVKHMGGSVIPTEVVQHVSGSHAIHGVLK